MVKIIILIIIKIEIEEEQSKKPIDENDVEKLIQVSKTMTLAEKIYQENRVRSNISNLIAIRNRKTIKLLLFLLLIEKS